MIMAKLKSAKGKKFLFGLLAVFIIAASVVTRATIGGVIEQYNIPLIMLSLGRDGSRAYYKDLRVEVKPFLQDSTIETTGAGDTFGGCCLHYVLKYGLDNLDEEKLTEMLTFANAAASIVTTRKGALRVMPEVEEVEAFIKSRA